MITFHISSFCRAIILLPLFFLPSSFKYCLNFTEVLLFHFFTITLVQRIMEFLGNAIMLIHVNYSSLHAFAIYRELGFINICMCKYAHNIINVLLFKMHHLTLSLVL